MISEAERHFLNAARVAHLATADAHGTPHLVPVCYALTGETIHITIDEKPKRTDRPLKRLRNIMENPVVALTIDRWDEDWSRLAWVMVHGHADILAHGAEHDAAQGVLREKYPQYRPMALTALPVIAIRIQRILSWGNLSG